MNGVFLNYLKSDKFKTSFLSINFLNQLSRENASLNALVPFVLKRGTMSYPNMEALSARLDELYGAVIEPVVRRTGEVQGIGFVASFPEEKYLPEGSSVTADVIELVADIVLHPNTRGGLFLPEYVDSEKENLSNLINSFINEKRSYSLKRCIEEMCCYEDIAVGKYGKSEDVEGINYKKLTKHYHSLIQTSPAEIFFCGQSDMSTVESMLKESFETLPRGEIDYDIGTDIRMNALEDEVRYYEENLDVTQGKLDIGFRLGECMEDPNVAALYVFNTVYGSGITSKLFKNVREKLQLCYYASSMLDYHKGILIANSGVDFDKFEEAKDEILHQLDLVKQGEITDEELSYAKAGVMSDLKAILDSQYDLESFYYSNNIEGFEWTPEELSELVNEVTKEQVVEIANSIECDLVYFLRNERNDAED